MRSLQLISRGDLLTPCFSLSRASHCWELLTAKARSLSLSGASYCWEAARCGEAHRCRELLTVGSFSLVGGVALLGGFSLLGASHCRERLIVWGRLAVGRQRLTDRSFSFFVGVLLLGGFSLPSGKGVVASEQQMSSVMSAAPRSYNFCPLGSPDGNDLLHHAHIISARRVVRTDIICYCEKVWSHQSSK